MRYRMNLRRRKRHKSGERMRHTTAERMRHKTAERMRRVTSTSPRSDGPATKSTPEPTPTHQRSASEQDASSGSASPRAEDPTPSSTIATLHELPALAQRMDVEGVLSCSDTGEVLRVVERRTRRPLVLKLRPLRGSSWTEWDRFEHEARVLRSLSHRGVPKHIEHGTHGPLAYLLMTRAPGRSLQQRLEAGERWSDVKLNHILTRMLEILGYLHDLNPPVFHCDVHPEHVMVSNAGDVQLISFGRARSMLPTDGIPPFGRQGYISARRRGTPASPRHDLYALGATMAAIASGADAALLPSRSDGLTLETCMKPSPIRDAIGMLMETSRSQPTESSRSPLAEIQRWLRRAKR